MRVACSGAGGEGCMQRREGGAGVELHRYGGSVYGEVGKSRGGGDSVRAAA